MLLAASFPGITFNARLYEEMLGDLPDVYFLEAVYDFIKTTKELYPGTNPIAILREKAFSKIPALPKPKKTAEELKMIEEMQEFYDRQKKQAEELFSKTAVKMSVRKNHRSPNECLKILNERGEQE